MNVEVRGLEVGIFKVGEIGGEVMNKEGEYFLLFGIGKIMMMIKID